MTDPDTPVVVAVPGDLHLTDPDPTTPGLRPR